MQVVNLDFAAGYDCGDEPSEASSQPEDDGQASISSIEEEQPDATPKAAEAEQADSDHTGETPTISVK